MDAVRFVHHVKKGPLTETSPMLSDISAIPTWAKARRWHQPLPVAVFGHGSVPLRVSGFCER